MAMDTELPIQRSLKLLGELIAGEGAEVRIVVVGGAALNLLGLVERTTRDIDVIALAEERSGSVRLARPDALPDALARAVARVARDLGLPSNWLNTEVASQWRTGLPPTLERDLEWRRYGGLRVGLPARLDLICLKLYASADQRGPDSRHVQDLLALKPTADELRSAASWIETQDPTIGKTVATVIEYVREHLS